MSTTTAQPTRTIAESVGTLLKQAREERGLSVTDAARRIKVSEKYLVLLEDSAYDKLPEDVYSRIYLKAYCALLGLDTTKVQKMYRLERARFEQRSGRKYFVDQHPAAIIPIHRLASIPKIVKSGLVVIMAIALGLYFASALKRIVVPPSITLSAPRDGFVTSERTIEVVGTTEPEVRLTINGERVATDGNGYFKDILTLQEGLNTIKVVGSKKYSKEMTVTRKVIVQPKERPTATLEGAVMTEISEHNQTY